MTGGVALNKNKLGFILIFFVLVISIFSVVLNKNIKSNNDQENLKADKNMLDIEKEILREDYKLVNDKKYSEAKNVNYRIFMFFNNLNNETNDAKIFPDFLEFLDISPSEYLNLEYRNISEDMLFYEIIDIEKQEEYNKILVKTKHKYKGGKVTFKEFSIGNDYIVDEPFLFAKDIKESVRANDIDFFIDSKAVFNDRVVYKINIKNNGKEIFIINEDMYSFYATRDKNKYYHNIEFGDITSYRIHPGTEKTLFIGFNNLKGMADVYININGRNLLLTSN